MATDGTHRGVWRWMRRRRAHLGLIGIGVALGCFGYGSYRKVERDLSGAALSGRTAIAVLAASTLTQDFERLIDIGRSLASRVRFGELIAERRWAEAAQIMLRVPSDFPSVEQVLLMDAQGKLRAVIPASEAESTSRAAPPPRTVPVSLLPFVSDVQADDGAAGPAHFLVVVPVLDADAGAAPGERLLAMLILRINTRRFVDLFAQLQLEPDAAIQVVDRQGRLAFDSGRTAAPPAASLARDPRVQRMLAGEVGVDVGAGTRDGGSAGGAARAGAADVVAFAPTAAGWGILARWSQQTVFAARDAQLRQVLFTCGWFAVLLTMAFGLLLRLAVERRQTHGERRSKLELESRVRERTEQLQKANIDLESFSYSVSHDLRAPLRAIDGYVHLLIEEQRDVLGANAKRCIDNVERNVRYMSRLIDELLELARVGRIALKLDTVDMGALVSEVLPAVLGNRSQVAVEVSALPPACADATLVRQIWFNLLDNAVKYSSHTPEPQITISAEVGPGHVTYCVADNGVGFDMQHYEQLFKPFSRLHSPGEFGGTGVGLALVKRIVERHEGCVWAESIPNQRTQVFFSLPTIASSPLQ